MMFFLTTCRTGNCTGISFIDSTSLSVCRPERSHSNKAFKGFAAKGKTSAGWFCGFKLHIVINDKGEIIDFMFSEGNTDDRYPLKNKIFNRKLFGKLFGDRGYLSQELFEQLYFECIQLITKIKKNMKNRLMLYTDKILLKKRSLTETVNYQLKNICQIEHSRHRSLNNFISNVISGLIAYSFAPKKPSLNFNIHDNKMIIL